MLKRAALLTMFALLQSFLLTTLSHAAAEQRLSLSPFIGGYTFDNSQELDSGVVYGLRAGYALDANWEVEGVIDYVSTDSETGLGDANSYNYRVDGLYNIPLGGKFVPYLAAGAGGNTTDYPDSRGTKTRAALNYGAGLKYFVSDVLALRGDLRHILVLEKMDKAIGNFEYTVGISWYPLAAGAVVAEEKDSDGDGVMDSLDKCPDTPRGVTVDKNGCPIDSDGDGVLDYLDKCPGTPRGVAVDKDGCPMDSDGDGVLDYLDKCPDTPKGVAVDKDGCPMDSDGDGVLDYLDKCPDTPKGVAVDKDGCPMDSDGDGVLDYLDKCPDTPRGVPVDGNGCPPSIEERTMRLNIEFDTGKADIKPRYFEEIKRVADIMKAYPDIEIEIGGHTDNVGSAAYNKDLSLRRAQSVKDRLVEDFGIDSGRLSATGYGPSRPVADNSTAEGRQRNRRIEAVVNYTVTK